VHAQDQRSRGDSSSTPELNGTVGDGHPSLIRLRDGGRSLIREVNERIEELNSDWEENGRTVVFCECAETECLEKIEISHFAYERIRGFATHYLVKPDHVDPADELVVAETAEYVVVEKLGPSASRADRFETSVASREERETPS
jgi:hypothetical protein